MSIGADPLATAVSLKAHRRGRNTCILSSKDRKDHGTKAFIEGARNFDAEANVILSDVITTGSSALLAADRMREKKYRPYVATILDER